MEKATRFATAKCLAAHRPRGKAQAPRNAMRATAIDGDGTPSRPVATTLHRPASKRTIHWRSTARLDFTAPRLLTGKVRPALSRACSVGASETCSRMGRAAIAMPGKTPLRRCEPTSGQASGSADTKGPTFGAPGLTLAGAASLCLKFGFNQNFLKRLSGTTD